MGCPTAAPAHTKPGHPADHGPSPAATMHPIEAAALAGQNPLYFTRTLLDYRSGQRANDAAKGMSTFAKRLTRAEIEALARYYADLPTRKK